MRYGTEQESHIRRLKVFEMKNNTRHEIYMGLETIVHLCTDSRKSMRRVASSQKAE